MSWTRDKDRLEAIAREIDSSIRLHTKDNFVSKFIAWTLFLVTFGKLDRERFLKDFATTLANHHFYPEGWGSWPVELTIIHEARHTKQFRWFGLGIHPLVGLVPMGICYLLIFLPVFLALPRLFLEIDADKFAWRMRARAEDVPLIDGSTLAESILRSAERRSKLLSGAAYAWSTPEFIARFFYMRAARSVISEWQQIS
jgi:hypothetical protein